jgi:hypothetical protein
MKYSVNYYLNSACKDRRPDTVEDAENDFCVEEFAARNDKAAIEKVFEIIDEEIIPGYSIDDEEGTRHLITTDFDKAIAFAKENGYYVFKGVLCQDGSEFKQDCDYEMIYDPAEANEEDI